MVDFLFILLIDALIFGVPLIFLSFLGISLFRFLYAKNKNKKTPDTYTKNEIKKRKITLIVVSVINGVFFSIVIGFIILFGMALANM